jgi:hypothetical protein
MLVRRIFYFAQFWAIPVLPLWLLVSRGIAIDGPGWGLVVLLFAAPLLSLALIAVMGLTVARRSVRRARMLSWVDVGVLAAWYASVVVVALIAHPLSAILAIALTLVAFWSAVWQLVAELRNRFSLVIARYDPARVVVR